MPTPAAPPASTQGSPADTPYIIPAIARPSIQAPRSPSATPAATAPADWPITRRTTSSRRAPIAIRMPISRTCRLTEKLTTLKTPRMVKATATRAKNTMRIARKVRSLQVSFTMSSIASTEATGSSGSKAQSCFLNAGAKASGSPAVRTTTPMPLNGCLANGR